MTCPWCGTQGYIHATGTGDTDLGKATAIIIVYVCVDDPTHKWHQYQTCEVKH